MVGIGCKFAEHSTGIGVSQIAVGKSKRTAAGFRNEPNGRLCAKSKLLHNAKHVQC